MTKNSLLLELFLVLFLLIAGDCVSTYLCLTTFSERYLAWEANPVTAWLFAAIGLLPGLSLMLVGKSLMFIPLYKLAQLSRGLYRFILLGTLLAVLLTAWVNYNNWSLYTLLLERI